MATVTFELTDGTTTLDLADDSGTAKYRLVMSALGVGPLQPVGGGPRSPYADAGYEVRQITAPFYLLGTAMADISTNSRNLEALIERARARTRERLINPTASPVYLNTQWGTVNANDLQYEVLDGSLQYPRHLLDVLWTNKGRLGHRQEPVVMSLTVRPWGVGTSTLFATGTLKNAVGTNYLDLNSLPGHGPARMQLSLQPSGASGTGTLWIGRISGSRQTATLGREGESYDSATVISAAGASNTLAVFAGTLESAGSYVTYVRHTTAAGSLNVSLPTGTLLATFNFILSGPPRGLYRVLARARFAAFSFLPADPVATGTLAFGAGYTYGSITSMPSTFASLTATWNFVATSPAATFGVFDLGELRILPGGEPTGGTIGTYVLSIVAGAGTFPATGVYGTSTGLNATMNGYHIGLDYVQLLPIDEGAAILTHAATNGVFLDTYSPQPGVYIQNAAGTIIDIPNRNGGAFDAGPDNSRIYIVRDDGTAALMVTTASVRPRFRGL